VLLSSVGNDNIHIMTSDRQQKLRIDFMGLDKRRYVNGYDNFRIGSEQDNYKLISIGVISVSPNAGQYC